MGARIFNIIFFCSSAFFFYKISLNYTTSHQAIWVTILSLMAPINTYTAVFMPESLYYFLFIVCMWSLLRIEPHASSSAWLLPGAVLGLNALVKPHAQLLIPAVLLYMVFLFGTLSCDCKTRLQSLFKAVILFVVGIYAIKLGLGYLLAGTAGLNLAGRAYSSIHYDFLASLPNFLHSLRGHIRGILILFGFPLLAGLYNLFFRQSDSNGLSYQRKVCLLTCLIACLMIVQVAFFTANIAGTGPYEHASRLHFRYYNFIFPFFILMSTTVIDFSSLKRKLIFYSFLIIYGLFLIYCFFVRIHPYIVSFIDCPELAAFQRSKSILFLFLTIVLILIYFLIKKKSTLSKNIYIYIILPLYFITSIIINSHTLHANAIPNIFDKTGIVISEYLTQEQKNKTIILSTNQIGAFRVLFYLDSPQASYHIIQEGKTFIPDAKNEENIFIVVGEDISFASSNFNEYDFNFFRLYAPARSSLPTPEK